MSNSLAPGWDSEDLGTAEEMIEVCARCEENERDPPSPYCRDCQNARYFSNGEDTMVIE